MKDSAPSVYINPLTDFGFKFIFGRDADKEFILSFLNAVLQPESMIEDVEFVDKENKGGHKDDRALIYDLHCKLGDGSKIIVEMQNRYQAHFSDRALYYLAADIHAQGQKGEAWQYELTPVYGIFIMNFEWSDVAEQYLREDVFLVNMQTKKCFSDKLGMTFLKIPMMDKDADECGTTLDRWLYLLKNMDHMEAMPHAFMQDPVFRRLGQVTRYAALDKDQKEAYQASLKTYRDNYAILQTERAEGRAEGRADGRVEGRMLERIDNIRMMLAHGLPAEKIGEMFGMGADEVRSIGAGMC